MNEKKKLSLISQYYGIGAFIYLVLAVLAVKEMIPSTFQVVTSYWTANPLLSQTSTVFAPATHVLWEIQFRWMLVLLMLLSIVVPVTYFYLISNNYKKIDLHKYRFVDWLVTSSVMLLIISVLAGVQDAMTLVLIIGLNVISYCLMWVAINNLEDGKSNNKCVYKLGVVSAVLPWLLIAVYVISTGVYGNVRSPGFVYALYCVGILSTAVLIYGYHWHKMISARKNKLLSDETYPILLNQVIKILFALFLIIGLKH